MKSMLWDSEQPLTIARVTNRGNISVIGGFGQKATCKNLQKVRGERPESMGLRLILFSVFLRQVGDESNHLILTSLKYHSFRPVSSQKQMPYKRLMIIIGIVLMLLHHDLPYNRKLQRAFLEALLPGLKRTYLPKFRLTKGILIMNMNV